MADGYSDLYWGGFYGVSFPYGTLQSTFPPYGAATTANPTTCMTPGTSSSTSTATPDIVVESGDGSDHTLDSDEEQVCF